MVPTITMRSFADEFKSGSFELLRTLPLTPAQLVWGKFFGAILITFCAVIPTLIYAVSVQQLSVTGGIDLGATAGSYIGLLLLGAVFTAIGICTSSFTSNTVVAFITGSFVCFLLYNGFDAISKLSVFSGGLDYYLEMLGISFHYRSMSRGVIRISDLIYFISVIYFFLLITQRNLLKR